jgi:hypothetical protein
MMCENDRSAFNVSGYPGRRGGEKGHIIDVKDIAGAGKGDGEQDK